MNDFCNKVCRCEYSRKIPIAPTAEEENSVIKLKQAVNEGTLDMAIAAMPVGDEFDVVPFVEEELMLFVHTSHGFANRDKV